LKKRKVEVEKKQEVKKPSSSILVGKAHLKSALKPSSSVTNPSQLFDSSSQAAPPEPSFSKYKGKTRLAQNPVDDDVSQPATLVQSQMAARVKAQINAAKRVEPAIPSENIELPEINSEYSDSEDEDRVRTFDPPEWAQSPELRQALEMQSTLNPDDIFGAVRPLRMEEIFKSRTSRFRARTSSANWTGADRLTMQEEKEYARRMGFK
jgi:Inner centromere protein, ARK binding region